MPSFWDEMDKLKKFIQDHDSMRDRMLRAAGWNCSSSFPDHTWRWFKTLPDGQRITCGANEAVEVESYLRPMSEVEKYEDDHQDEIG